MNISPRKKPFGIGVFTQNMIKNVIFNKTKNTRVCFFIYISSACVHLFTAFEVAVLKLYVPFLVEYGRHFHGNEPNQGEFIFYAFSIFFILIIINIQWNEWFEKLTK